MSTQTISKKKTLLTGVLAAAAALGLAISTPLAANAASAPYGDKDNVTVSAPAGATYVDNETVTVSVASGLAANTELRIGQCEWQTIYIPAFGADIPACGNNWKNVTTDSNGGFTTTFQLKSVAPNAHGAIPGQEPNVDFANNIGEIVVTPTHGIGGAGSYLGDSTSFYVN